MNWPNRKRMPDLLTLRGKPLLVGIGVIICLAIGGVNLVREMQARAHVHVTTIPVPACDDSGQLSLSPDGRWLAYPMRSSIDCKIVLYDIKNNRIHQISYKSPGNPVVSFGKAIWSPDSAKLYLGDANDQWFTEVMDLNTFSRWPLPENTGRVTATCSDCGIRTLPLTNNTGQTSAYASGILDRIRTPFELTSSTLDYVYPAPGGDHLLCQVGYGSGTWGGTAQWYYLDLTGSFSHPVPIEGTDQGPEYAVVWSSDGKKAYGLRYSTLIVISVN